MTPQPNQPQEVKLTTLSVSTLNQIITFISNHRGITHAEADPVIQLLTITGNAGIEQYEMMAARIAELETETRLMAEKLMALQDSKEAGDDNRG